MTSVNVMRRSNKLATLSLIFCYNLSNFSS
eukprot:SAG31_NODE_45106_length_260_cov_0.639752_2_plen_29_part_01